MNVDTTSEESPPEAPMPSAPGYLVVVDDTPEAKLALRYAARRAKAAGGSITLLHVIPEAEFMQWGGVQDMIAQEAQDAAQALLARVAEEVIAMTGLRPSVLIRQGKTTEEVGKAIADDETISALVLGAAPKGAPGPLVAHFSGERAGGLRCVVVIVPGALDNDAIDRLT